MNSLKLKQKFFEETNIDILDDEYAGKVGRINKKGKLVYMPKTDAFIQYSGWLENKIIENKL